MEINKQYVNNLLNVSAKLPHRANQRIQAKTGFSLSLISRVRHGKAYNDKILEAILEEYETADKRDADLINRLKKHAR